MSDKPQATAQAPRRSSRISAQTKVEVSAPAKKERKPSKAGIKRAAEEVANDEKNKQVRHSKPGSVVNGVI